MVAVIVEAIQSFVCRFDNGCFVSRRMRRDFSTILILSNGPSPRASCRLHGLVAAKARKFDSPSKDLAISQFLQLDQTHSLVRHIWLLRQSIRWWNGCADVRQRINKRLSNMCSGLAIVQTSIAKPKVERRQGFRWEFPQGILQQENSYQFGQRTMY